MTTLRAGEIARMTEVSPDTVRYYERRGLLPRVPRDANGYRKYPESAIRRIMVVRRALDAGFSVRELSQVLRECDAGGAPCRQVLAIGRDRLGELERRVEQLTALRDESASPNDVQSSARRSRSAFAMTDTELNVIAALAIIGLRRRPNHG